MESRQLMNLKNSHPRNVHKKDKEGILIRNEINLIPFVWQRKIKIDTKHFTCLCALT